MYRPDGLTGPSSQWAGEQAESSICLTASFSHVGKTSGIYRKAACLQKGSWHLRCPALVLLGLPLCLFLSLVVLEIPTVEQSEEKETEGEREPGFGGGKLARKYWAQTQTRKDDDDKLWSISESSGVPTRWIIQHLHQYTGVSALNACSQTPEKFLIHLRKPNSHRRP